MDDGGLFEIGGEKFQRLLADPKNGCYYPKNVYATVPWSTYRSLIPNQ